MDALHRLTRHCFAFAAADFRQPLRQSEQQGECHAGGTNAASPAASAKAAANGLAALCSSAAKCKSHADAAQQAPLLRAWLLRREQLLLCVLLLCVAQVAWIQQAQSHYSLLSWVKEEAIEPEPGQPPSRRSVLPAVEVLGASPDECVEALRLPRVALMFLTTGELYHEETWRLWFKSAGGLLPAQVVADSVCDSNGATKKFLASTHACSGNSTNEIEAQHLFSVYIHAPPDFDGYGAGSLWAGRLVRHRVATTWGSHSLVEATRLLLWEAFRDPRNSRFLLLSETDVPLYDPLTLYQQLQSESASRLDTCKGQLTSQWRWDPRMETPRLKFHMWRKSPQWLTLTRAHAEIVLRDEEVYRKFERHCWSSWDERHQRWHRDCFSDEHYFATLLAAEGLDEEGVCESRGASYTEWTDNSAHPKSFPTAHIDAELIRRARSAPTTSSGSPTAACNWAAAQAAAARLFVPTARALSASSAEECSQFWHLPPSFEAALPPTCFLTARKFPWEARDRVRAVFLQCTSGVNLLRRDVCVAEGGSVCSGLWAAIKGSFSRDPC